MDLTWLDPEDPGGRELAGMVAVAEGARAVDTPYRRSITLSSHRGSLRYGWDGDQPRVGVALAGGRVVASLTLTLPRRDNTHLCYFDIVVDPLVRRRGLGRELLQVVLGVAREEGRRTLMTSPYGGSPGEPFCAAAGFAQVYRESQREQRVLELDADHLAAMRRDAEKLAEDFELVAYAGALPDALLDEAARLGAVINDAPVEQLDMEDEVYDAERIRTFERAQALQGRRLHRVVARHRGTGEPAGHTVVAVEVEHPWLASQYDTSVAAAHRGHRLGLLLKLEMLRHLAGAEPQVRSLFTWNADSNAHMVGVNEQLGYRVVAGASEWQRAL